MRPDDADRSYLLDMLKHAQGAVEALRGKSLENYVADETLRLSIERRVEIIGEAARGLSEPFRSVHPDIPWRKIISQRHVLAHEYGEIEDSLVFAVVTLHLPVLIRQIEEILVEKA